MATHSPDYHATSTMLDWVSSGFCLGTLLKPEAICLSVAPLYTRGDTIPTPHCDW